MRTEYEERLRELERERVNAEQDKAQVGAHAECIACPSGTPPLNAHRSSAEMEHIRKCKLCNFLRFEA